MPLWRGGRYPIPYGGYFRNNFAIIVSDYYGYPVRAYGEWDFGSDWGRPWRIGYPLDGGWREIPYDLYERLPPPPYGYRYVLYGGDILLINNATGIVVDAVLSPYY